MKRVVRHNAFQAQPSGFSGPPSMGAAARPGFHTGGSLSICQPYAQQKMTNLLPVDWDLDLQRPLHDYPVIVELDMQGLPFEIDYDAAHWFSDAVEAALEYERTFDDFESSLDTATTEEDLPESMIAALFYLSGARPERALYNLRDWLREQPDPEKAYTRLREEGISDELLATVSQQFRYTEDVPSGRVVAIHYVRPVFDYLFPHYEDPEYEHDEIIDRIEGRGYDTVSLENVYEFQEVMTVVRHIRIPRLWNESRKRLEFHGTSLGNLLLAAPELREMLPSPPPPFEPAALFGGRGGD